jgi:hypothetical protein
MFKENICIFLFTFEPSEIFILNIAYFLENYIGMDDWHCRYIRSCCTYVCRIKQGRKTHALWRVSWLTRNVKCYSRGVAQTEDITTEFNCTLSQRYRNSPISRNSLKTQDGRRVASSTYTSRTKVRNPLAREA